jgi:hypothetical protein
MPSIALDANVVKTTECPVGKARVDLYDTVIPGFIVEIRYWWEDLLFALP